MLLRCEGVESAAVSYASGRAHVRWDPTETDLTRVTDRIARLGYQPRLLGDEAQPDRGLMLRLGVAVFAALNVMLATAALYAGWVDGMDPRFQELFRWTSLVLATPVALWCAAPFFDGAWRGLRAGTLHMDVPVALAIAVLYGHGVIATMMGVDGYLDSLTMLVALLLGGRVIESRGRRRAADAATTLAASLPVRARRWEGDHLTEVGVDELEVGDRIEVAQGAEVAADGVVVEGAGTALMALITGESQPVGVGPGDTIVAGAVLETGAVTVQIQAVGSQTTVQRMVSALADAADRPSGDASDRIAPWFTAATLGVATLTFAVWWILSGMSAAVETTVAVLVVACPCALALARPLTGMAALGAAARRGALFRSTDALLRLSSIDTLAVDKTGTITRGDMVVVQADDAALRIAAGLERASSHPIAGAILDECGRRDIAIPVGRDVRETSGTGIEGWVDGSHWSVRAGGPGRVHVWDENGPRWTIHLGDRVRSDSERAVRTLRDMGVHVALLTGDHPEVAEHMAAQVGIEDVSARMAPEAKATWVRVHQARGERVLFVGDGINDGPALGAADVGLAMRSGAASSLLMADGVVAGGSLRAVAAAVRAAREGVRAMRSNRLRSIGYNLLAVSAAALGFVNPLVAAVLMPMSSGLVLAGALSVERRMQRAAATVTA